MLYRLLKSDSEVGVEHENSIQEVKRLWTGPWVLFCQVSFRDLLERLQVFESLHISDERFISFRGGANYLKDYSELILIAEGKP